MLYTLNDIKVLKNIMDREDETKGLSKSTGSTVKEIVAKTKLSDKKVRLAIKKFLDDEMIAYGIADGRTKTYYILPKGLEEIFSLKEMVVKED
ncbi:hypothetical protein [Clostridium sardiniense]|uniref:hypothetical protein n=1 Tax=Clostridium sardiniense TaxID=29369 RepID=UPI0019583022|nr:hypothetical protein [Clostridium sardiniense]MBM7836295.1 DNA-binding transcriptional regulator GbsR (MarR family) [Clostridium sardiniense]